MTFLPALLLSSTLAALALWKRALTPGGTALAWALCLQITYAGGVTAFAILAVTLVCTVAADQLAGGRADPHAVRHKSGSRDASRVLCNVGIGALAMVLYQLLSHRTAFAIAYVAVMAESLADSLASKLGPLSKHPPVDICTFRPVEAGLSGGVTWIGTLSELCGSAVIGLIYALGSQDACSGFLACACGFFGAVFDSVLGSRVQVKYQCPVCKQITEREIHCGALTKQLRGVRCVNNDVVNLMSNGCAFGLALLFSAVLVFKR